MISVVLGFHLCVSRRSLQLTLALVCWWWLGCFLLVSVGELIFDLFLTSSNNLTATVESNAATEKKNIRLNSGTHTSTTLVCVPLMPDYQVAVLPAWLATNYAIGISYHPTLCSKLLISSSSSHPTLLGCNAGLIFVC